MNKTRKNSIVYIDTIADLRNTIGSAGAAVDVLGYYTSADTVGARQYVWDAVSVEADNGGITIQVTGVVTGRWKMKYSGAVNVKWFGAKGDNVADDTIPLLNTLLSCDNINIDGDFRTTSPIVISKSNLNIIATSNASIIYDGIVGSTGVIRVNDADSFILSGSLTIDCATKAGIGIEVRAIDGATKVDISGVVIKNCTHSSPSTSGACGIQVLCNSGSGKIAKVVGNIVSSVTRTTSDGVGATCAGICVEDFDVMTVNNNVIEGVSKGNGTQDADGIKVFSSLTAGNYSNCVASVDNNKIKNCEGRFVKTQVRGRCTVSNNYFALDNVLDLIASFRAVDAQISDTIIEHNVVDLLSSWTGGAEMIIFYVQFNAVNSFAGQKIEHKVINNTVFSIAGTPEFSRAIFADFTSMGTNICTAFAQIEGNIAVGSGGWEGTSIGTIGITIRPPETAFAVGSTASVLLLNNRVNTANFMERFANGVNATGAYDFTGKLMLSIVGNFLPKQRGNIACVPHDANNSYTSSFCVANNSVGTRGNYVAIPFDFSHLLSGNGFITSTESTPARTNAPANYLNGTIERIGNMLICDNRTYRYYALADIGAIPTWGRFGNKISSAWTAGTYTASRIVPNSATATTVQLADALNTLVADLKLAGMAT